MLCEASTPHVAQTRAAGFFSRAACTDRHAILLPAEAGSDDRLLSLRASYRVEKMSLTVAIDERDPGRLVVTLLAYDGHFPTKTLWTSPARLCQGPCTLTMDLQSGTITLADHEWGRVPLPLPTRRFCLRLSFTALNGQRRERLTGHYLPGKSRAADEKYFHGDDYVDYDAQSVEMCADVLRLVRQYAVRAPVLEVGAWWSATALVWPCRS